MSDRKRIALSLTALGVLIAAWPLDFWRFSLVFVGVYVLGTVAQRYTRPDYTCLGYVPGRTPLEGIPLDQCVLNKRRHCIRHDHAHVDRSGE